MSMPRKALLACLAATASLVVLQPAWSAPAPRPPPGGSPGAHPPGGPGYGGQRPSYPGAQRPGHAGGHRYYGHSGHSGSYRHYGAPYWGWSLALGVPWALGWHDPWWGPAYYPSYAYGPVYRGYGYGYGNACELDEACWRALQAQDEQAPPTTEVAPAAPGEEGGPTQRPLHLNYCDAARAWYPHVRTCPGGWRMIRPEYDRQP